jgi:serine/threonine protein kinase
MELRPDVVLAGKLRLLRILGQGGMGVVWAARHLTLDTEVAVKVIRPERVTADPSLRARFEREARATARISHPHVVKIMDYGTVDDAVPFIVMELLPGFSLADLLGRGGRLSLATATSLVEQVGSALECAHAHGIVHRDIKPHNVFITEGSRDHPLSVKVLDFGVAKMLADADALDAGAALTETGLVIGSAPYMSPEQLEGRRDVDARSDLWSLGVIVYEVLTGALPFQGGSFVTVGAAVLKGQYRPASELQPNLPEAIEHWFAKTLCVERGERFQTAREMIASFNALNTPEAEAAPTREGHVGEERVANVATLERSTETLGHAPMASAPESAAAPSKTASIPRTRHLWRALVFSFAACALAAIGAGLFARSRAATSAGCPPGMVVIQDATFRMGSPAEADTPSDETPPSNLPNVVSVRLFCLDTTEVTVRAYSRCKTCEHAQRTVEFEGLTPNGRAFASQFCNTMESPEHPMNCVDWREASDYCVAQGKRLPTEAEWELSARGKELRTYAWGDAPPSGERLNACGAECSRMMTQRLEKIGKGTAKASSLLAGPWPEMYADDDAAEATAPVGQYPRGATPEGVMDLAGNVWEWTGSFYCPYPYGDGATCGDSRRVLRGGGWDTTEAADVRAARRYPSSPSARGKSIGFRCAKSPGRN